MRARDLWRSALFFIMKRVDFIQFRPIVVTDVTTALTGGGDDAVEEGLDWHALTVIVIVSLGTVCNILAFRVMSSPSMAFLNAYFYLKGSLEQRRCTMVQNSPE